MPSIKEENKVIIRGESKSEEWRVFYVTKYLKPKMCTLLPMDVQNEKRRRFVKVTELTAV